MATGTIILPILAAVGDPTNQPGADFTAAGRPYLAFDTTTDEKVLWAFRMPENYASGLVMKIQYSCPTLTTGNAAFETEVQVGVVDTDDIDTDSFSTVSTFAGEAVPGTAGVLGEISHTMGNLDSLDGGDHVTIRLTRDTGTTSDVAEDIHVWAVSLEYTTT